MLASLIVVVFILLSFAFVFDLVSFFNDVWKD